MANTVKIKREYLIGGFVVIIFILFLWGVSFLKNDSPFHKNIEYIGIYDKVNGLLIDNPVMVKGIRIGKVKELGLCSDNPEKVFVRILLIKNVNIPDNSRMMIVSSDLLGAKAIEIELGNSAKFLSSGDTIQTGTQKTLQEEVSRQVLPIKKKAEQLILSIDSLIGNIQAVLNENTRQNLRESFESIRKAIKNLEQTSYNIDTLMSSQKSRMKRILENIESISGNMKNNNENITNILDNFSSISDTLTKANIAKTLKSADKALIDFSDITDKISKGKGSIGLLLNNDSLYNNLQSSSAELDKLLKDFRLHPKRYVHFSVFGRGAKNNKYKPPVNDEK